MSRSSQTEHAKATVDPSIVEQAHAAADAYPYLNIRCPVCDKSIIGSVFKFHFEEHADAESPAPDHWMAL